MTKLILNVVLGIFTATSPLLAQETQKGFTGKVTCDDAVVSNAVVIVTDMKTSESEIFSADTLGNYAVPSNPERFILHVYSLGYLSFTDTLSIENFPDRYIVTELEMDPKFTLDQVTVRASPSTLKREMGKFVLDNIENIPFSKGNNTLNFLRYIPMLDVKPEGGISIMGKENAVIYVNGRPAGGGMPPEAMLRSIPAENIERIEIVAVPGSSQSAASSNGIINVILKKRPNEGVRVTVSLEDVQQHYNSIYGSAFLSYSTDKLDITSGISASRYHRRTGQEQNFRDHTTGLDTRINSFNITDIISGGAFLNADYRLTPKQLIGMRFSVNGTDDRNSSQAQSFFSRSGGITDSVYHSLFRNSTPGMNLRISGNINYNLKTDDKGSVFSADINYYRSHSNTETFSIYDKIINGQSIIERDFLQAPQVLLNAAGIFLKYNHNFDENNVLKSGASFHQGRTDNDFFFGNNIGGTYVSDEGRTNRFKFEDHTAAAYLIYERTWSDKFESSLGLRLESYHADGTQMVTGEKTKRDETDLYPSISLNYTINDNHELSLDASASVFRPTYSMLNPFIIYTSPTTYIRNNPELKSSKGCEAMLTYSFFKNYTLSLEYMYDKDLWTEFTLPSADGMTQIFTDNYGNSHDYTLYFMVSKRIFDGYYISGNAQLNYSRIKGEILDMPIDIEDMNYRFTLNNNLVISKKHNWSMSAQYQYGSESKGPAFIISAHHDLEIYLNKQFKNSSLSLGGYRLINQPKVRSNEGVELEFTRRNIVPKAWTISYTHTFGNPKVKRIFERDGSEFSRRLQ